MYWKPFACFMTTRKYQKTCIKMIKTSRIYRISFQSYNIIWNEFLCSCTVDRIIRQQKYNGVYECICTLKYYIHRYKTYFIEIVVYIIQ